MIELIWNFLVTAVVMFGSLGVIIVTAPWCAILVDRYIDWVRKVTGK